MKKKTLVCTALLVLVAIALSGFSIYSNQNFTQKQNKSATQQHTIKSSQSQPTASSSVESRSRSGSESPDSIKSLSDFNAQALKNDYYIGRKTSKGEIKLTRATKQVLKSFEQKYKGEQVVISQQLKDDKLVRVIMRAKELK